MKTYEGKDIREVWDWRLSIAQPILYNSDDTWVINIVANDGSGVLKEIVTDIPTRDANGVRNPYDTEAVAKCFALVRDIRADYSRPNIEELKPQVAAINAKNRELAEMGGAS